MSARLTMTLNGASLNELRAWCDRAERLGVDPRAPVVFGDGEGRIAIPVSVRRVLLPDAEPRTRRQSMRPARRAKP